MKIRLIEGGYFSFVIALGWSLGLILRGCIVAIFLRAYTPEMDYRARVITLGLDGVFGCRDMLGVYGFKMFSLGPRIAVMSRSINST